MSAYIVSDEHINALLNAGLHWGRGGSRELKWFTPEEPEDSDYERGEPWGPTAGDSMRRRRRTLSTETADAVGTMLKEENHRSVNHRYAEDDHVAGLFIFQSWIYCSIDPAAVLKACDGYEYQSCEHPGWACSEAQAFLSSLRKEAIRNLPGYESGPWEVSKPNDIGKHMPGAISIFDIAQRAKRTGKGK